MRRKSGILLALRTIAIGATIGSGATMSAAQDSASLPGDGNLALLCKAILDTQSPSQFRGLPIAVNAFNNASDPCHDVAVAQWALLTSGQGTGAVNGPGNVAFNENASTIFDAFGTSSYTF